MSISDLNNDGKNEIIHSSPGWNAISVYESDEDYKFSTYELFNVYGVTWFQRNLAIGDLNNDLYQDIAVSHNNGRGGFSYIINTSYMVSSYGSSITDNYIISIFPNPAHDFLKIAIEGI